MGPNELLLVAIIIVVTIAVILLIREIVCWYFKINERLRIQRITLETLLKIYEQNGGDVNWEDVKNI